LEPSPQQTMNKSPKNRLQRPFLLTTTRPNLRLKPLYSIITSQFRVKNQINPYR
jgi:hypothetical protein